jgi:hypothetical protein
VELVNCVTLLSPFLDEWIVNFGLGPLCSFATLSKVAFGDFPGAHMWVILSGILAITPLPPTPGRTEESCLENLNYSTLPAPKQMGDCETKGTLLGPPSTPPHRRVKIDVCSAYSYSFEVACREGYAVPKTYAILGMLNQRGKSWSGQLY